MAFHSSRELKPGIYHLTDAHALRFYPGDRHPGWVEREIVVESQAWPFGAGETPLSYARRVVAAVDEAGEVFDVAIAADVTWPRRRPSPGPVDDERIIIKYRTPR